MLKRKKVCACHLEGSFKVDPRISEEASVRRCMHLRLLARDVGITAEESTIRKYIQSQDFNRLPRGTEIASTPSRRCSGVQLCSICSCTSPSKTVFMELCANLAPQMSHGQIVLVETKPNAYAEIVLQSWGPKLSASMEPCSYRLPCGPASVQAALQLHPMLRTS